MAFYAVDQDDMIHASDATPDKVYHCLDCFRPVKKRKGKWKFAHFYHLKSSPSCRLYSKSEDHLVAQMELQKMFPPGDIQLEKPFSQINRIADAFLEKEKIVFEIQCSPITEKEVEMRIRDYGTLGYKVIWLLDDKRYNKRMCRPAEIYLRERLTYYISIKQLKIYDQFEIFSEGKRIKKGQPFFIDLRFINSLPKPQVIYRKKQFSISKFFKKYFLTPYSNWLLKILKWR